MPAITLECPHCNANLKVKNSNVLGKRVPCPKCGERFVAEALEDDGYDDLDDEHEDDYDDRGYDDEEDDYDERPSRGSRTRGGRSSARSSSGRGGKSGRSSGAKKKSQQKSKLPLIIAASVAGLLIVVGGVFGIMALMGGGGENSIDMAHMPEDTELIVRVKVAEIWKAPVMAEARNNPMVSMMLNMGLAQLGNLKIEDFDTLTVGMPGWFELADKAKKAGQKPNFDSASAVAVLRLSKPIDGPAMATKFQLATKEYGGQTYYMIPGPQQFAIWFADESTIVAGLNGTSLLEKAIDSAGKAPRIARFDVIDPNEQLIFALAPASAVDRTVDPGDIPDPELKEIVELASKSMQSFAIGVSLTNGVRFSGRMMCDSASNAEAIKAEVDKLKQFAMNKIDQELRKNPFMAGQAATAKKLMDAVQVSVNDKTVVANAEISADQINEMKKQVPGMGGNPFAGGGMNQGGVNVDGPDVGVDGGGQPQGGGPFAARQAAQMAKSMNNIKQMLLAMHNYHDTHGKFPDPYIKSDDGKPLLSWRVSLLPFLEQKGLYDRFKLDESWDSPNNRPLLDQMPDVFQTPWGNRKGNKTNYFLITGQQTVFENGTGMRLRDITDGTSNTAMLFEDHVPKEVEWTKPQDLEYKHPQTHIVGSIHWNGIMLFGMADGSVKRIHHTTPDRNVLHQMITRNGGEDINWDAIKTRP